MSRTIPMRNGIFLAPFHPLDQDPTEAIHRDLELVETWTGSAMRRPGSASTIPPATVTVSR